MENFRSGAVVGNGAAINIELGWIPDLVEVYSGTWAGGDAAGFFVVRGEDIVGTFASENVIGEAAGATNDATVTVQVVHGYDSDTEGAADNAGIVPYVGVLGTNSKGFTIASGLATEAKLLRWAAWRHG